MLKKEVIALELQEIDQRVTISVPASVHCSCLLSNTNPGRETGRGLLTQRVTKQFQRDDVLLVKVPRRGLIEVRVLHAAPGAVKLKGIGWISAQRMGDITVSRLGRVRRLLGVPIGTERSSC